MFNWLNGSASTTSPAFQPAFEYTSVFCSKAKFGEKDKIFSFNDTTTFKLGRHLPCQPTTYHLTTDRLCCHRPLNNKVHWAKTILMQPLISMYHRSFCCASNQNTCIVIVIQYYSIRVLTKYLLTVNNNSLDTPNGCLLTSLLYWFSANCTLPYIICLWN